MSRGAGILQRAILQKTSSNPTPIFQNKLLWELAIERNEILKKGKVWGTNGTPVEEGLRKKSFEISFRQAVKKLNNQKEIIITPRLLFEIDEIIECLPYLTNRLEVLETRKALLPSVKKYIFNEKPEITHRDFDPFGYQLNIIKENNKKLYADIYGIWLKTEKNIIRILKNHDSPRFDSWINLLMWGRYYFREAKDRHKPIIIIPQDIRTTEEHIAINQIKTITARVKTLIDYKIGEAKKILYKLFHVPRYRKTDINDELKYYLFKEHDSLMRALPGDSDPIGFSQASQGGSNFIDPRLRTYSPLVEELFTRHIFRKLSFITAPLPPAQPKPRHCLRQLPRKGRKLPIGAVQIPAVGLVL